MRTPKVVNSFVCCDGLIVVREYSDGICRNYVDQNWQVKRHWQNAVMRASGGWTEKVRYMQEQNAYLNGMSMLGVKL